MTLPSFFVLSLLALATYSQIFDRCALIKELEKGGVVGFKSYTLGDYVCLTKHISDYDTSLHFSDSEYGIFQINSLWWCDDGKTVGRHNLCGLLCTELLNENITDDIHCLRRIVKDLKGLSAWPVWEEECKGKDLSQYTKGCNDTCCQ